MSPSRFGGSDAYALGVHTSGTTSNYYVDYSTVGVRAVITLKSDSLKYSTNSDGTINRLFTVTG